MRQYIGARYVPTFADPLTWDNSHSYEALMMVVYMGDTYTSKKPVPPGIAITDTEYWAMTGAFNSQLSLLSNRVSDLETESEKHVIKQKDRNYILIFDSFGGLGVSTLAEQACPGGVHSINVGGAGFVGAGGGSTWEQALTTYIGTLSADDKAAITDVMVFGGINDYSFTDVQITSAMTSFNTTVKNNLQNAHVTLATTAFPTRLDGTYKAYVFNVLATYSLVAQYLGWTYTDKIQQLIHNDKYIGSDGIHPNSTGVDRLGHAIRGYIQTGCAPSLTTAYEAATLTPGSADFTTTSCVFNTAIANDTISLHGKIIMVSSTVFNLGQTETFLGSLTDSWMFGITDASIAVFADTVNAYVKKSDNTWELIPLTVTVYYGRVYISAPTTIAISAIQTQPFCIQGPANMA